MSTITLTRLSATCQQVVESRLDFITGTRVVIRSMSPTIIDHKCNGTVLTPSGLHADMAVETEKHIWRHYGGKDAELPAFNICDLEVHTPIIVKDPAKIEQQWLEVGKQPPRITPDGERLQANRGHCSVRFAWYYGWLSDWYNEATAIDNRINALYKRAAEDDSSNVQLVQKASAHRLFQSFVDYTGKYQNLSEFASTKSP